MVTLLMQFPFKLEDVRLISIEGDTVRLVLPHGYVEVKLDARGKALRKVASEPMASRVEPKHIMFDDGIYGI